MKTGERVVSHFGFLQAQHIWLDIFNPLGHPFETSFERVHIPRGESNHASSALRERLDVATFVAAVFFAAVVFVAAFFGAAFFAVAFFAVAADFLAAVFFAGVLATAFFTAAFFAGAFFAEVFSTGAFFAGAFFTAAFFAGVFTAVFEVPFSGLSMLLASTLPAQTALTTLLLVRSLCDAAIKGSVDAPTFGNKSHDGHVDLLTDLYVSSRTLRRRICHRSKRHIHTHVSHRHVRREMSNDQPLQPHGRQREMIRQIQGMG